MKLLDLFCGAGGLSYGFERAGFDIALGVDMNAAALETFRCNHRNAAVLCGDLTNNALKAEIVAQAEELGIREVHPAKGFP